MITLNKIVKKHFTVIVGFFTSFCLILKGISFAYTICNYIVVLPSLMMGPKYPTDIDTLMLICHTHTYNADPGLHYIYTRYNNHQSNEIQISLL